MNRRAFTLVEMMIAAAISSVLMLALVSLFLGSNNLIGGIRTSVRGSLRERVARDHELFDPTRQGGIYALPGKEVSP